MNPSLCKDKTMRLLSSLSRPCSLSLTSMAVALLSLGLGFTAPEASAQEPVSLAGAQRIVSVGGAVTEVVYALGAEDRLVARDSTSSYPPEALALPDTGYMRALSPEGVLAVAPDGLLVIEGSGPAEALDVLRKAGVPLVMVPDRYTAEGVAEKVRVVGKALGLEDKAEDLAVKLEADLKAVAEAAAKREVKPRVLFILSMQGGRIMASGEGSAADAVIQLAGGVNAMSGFKGYKPLSDEAITEAKPDIILMMERGGQHDATLNQMRANAALSLTPAVQAGAIVRMDGLFMIGFGPRTADAVRELSAAFDKAAAASQ